MNRIRSYQQEQTGGLDCFKVIAAFLVVAIHTSPLNSLTETGDFILTGILARVAVPFFLMVSGYFILPPYLGRHTSPSKLPPDGTPSMLSGFLKKTVLLYAAASVLYVPVGIYANNYGPLGFLSLLRTSLFDGTFYHLWYLPASVIGMILLSALGRRLTFPAVLGISAVLYLFGLFGDSYFGVISGTPLAKVYEAVFTVSSYTRNGFFFVPVFLCLGALCARLNEKHRERDLPEKDAGEKVSGQERSSDMRRGAAGLSISLCAMLTEGLLLHHFGLQRHDSMYISLPFVMFFLFRLLLGLRIAQRAVLRPFSTAVYILHPLCIIAVRGAAKFTGLTGLLIGNSIVHYLAVCLLSAAVSVLCVFLFLRFQKRKGHQIPSGPNVSGPRPSGPVHRFPFGNFYRFRRFRPAPEGRAWAELDRDALRHNVESLRALLPEGCDLMPAVKANAYGHGALLTARELNDLGIRSFCVASAAEGATLRRRGILGDILVLGYTMPPDFSLLKRFHLIQTVADYDHARTLNRFGKSLRVHVAVDTGMHRLGTDVGEIERICRIFQMEHLQIEGIFSHLCVSDMETPKERLFTQKQYRRLLSVMDQLKDRGITPPPFHLLSSYGLLRYPEFGGRYARVGIALYGVLSTQEDTQKLGRDLRPALSVKARVASVRRLHPGESAGYGLAFTAQRETVLAAVTIGYADGLPRSLSCGRGSVLINGRRAPIAGRICMDQMLADITDIPDVRAGDVAVILGKSGDLEITSAQLAEQAGTISNEILSRLGSRLMRTAVC